MQTENFKDYFRKQAQAYSQYRPGYPDELYSFIADNAPSTRGLWDVATGNGQAARGLAQFFDQIWATDVSPEQLAQATGPAHVSFSQASAEVSGLADASVDAITVATAAHWFDLPAFYEEVRRVGRPGALLAIWCYDHSTIDHPVGDLAKHVAQEVLADDWSEPTKIALSGYADIEFPFDEIETPTFVHTARWTLDDILGIIESWSATQTYKARTGEHPVSEALLREFVTTWGDTKDCEVTWNITMRAGFVR